MTSKDSLSKVLTFRVKQLNECHQKLQASLCAYVGQIAGCAQAWIEKSEDLEQDKFVDITVQLDEAMMMLVEMTSNVENNLTGLPSGAGTAVRSTADSPAQTNAASPGLERLDALQNITDVVQELRTDLESCKTQMDSVEGMRERLENITSHWGKLIHASSAQVESRFEQFHASQLTQIQHFEKKLSQMQTSLGKTDSEMKDVAKFVNVFRGQCADRIRALTEPEDELPAVENSAQIECQHQDNSLSYLDGRLCHLETVTDTTDDGVREIREELAKLETKKGPMEEQMGQSSSIDSCILLATVGSEVCLVNEDIFSLHQPSPPEEITCSEEEITCRLEEMTPTQEITHTQEEMTFREDAMTLREDAMTRRQEEMTRAQEEMTFREDAMTLREDAMTHRQEEMTRAQEAMTRRQEEMTRRHEEMTRRQEEITRREEEITCREEEMTSRQEAMTCRLEEMTRTDEAMNRRQEEVTCREKVLTYTQEAMSRRQEEMARRQEEITMKEEAMAHRQEEITMKEEAMTRRQEEMTMIEEAMTHRQEAMAHRQEEITMKEETMTRRQEEMTRRQEEITTIEAAMTHRQEEMTMIEETMTCTQEAMNRRQEEMVRRQEEITCRETVMTYTQELMTCRQDEITCSEEAMTRAQEAMARRQEVVALRQEEITIIEEAMTRRQEAMTRRQEAMTMIEEAMTRREEEITYIEMASPQMDSVESTVSSQPPAVKVTEPAATRWTGFCVQCMGFIQVVPWYTSIRWKVLSLGTSCGFDVRDGVFTAPVCGLYLVIFVHYQTGTKPTTIRLILSDKGHRNERTMITTETTNGNEYAAGQRYITMKAGDTFCLCLPTDSALCRFQIPFFSCVLVS